MDGDLLLKADFTTFLVKKKIITLNNMHYINSEKATITHTLALNKCMIYFFSPL